MFETLQESGPLKFVLAFVFVLVLIGVVAWVIRRFGSERFGGAATRGRQPRLGVVDKVELGDGRRRLVIIRRDNVEHLIMIGGPQDVVIEAGIDSNLAARRESPFSASEERIVPTFDGPSMNENRPIPLRPTPRPAVFGDRTPSLRASRATEPQTASNSQLETDEDR